MTLESLVDAYGYVAVLVAPFSKVRQYLYRAGSRLTGGIYGFTMGDPRSIHWQSLWGSTLLFPGSLAQPGDSFQAADLEGSCEQGPKTAGTIQNPPDTCVPLLIWAPYRCSLCDWHEFSANSRVHLPQCCGGSGLGRRSGDLGYLFGSALGILIGNIKHYEIKILGAIAAIGVLIWAVYFYRCKKRTPALMKSY